MEASLRGCVTLVEELHVTLGRLGITLGLARDAFAWIDGDGCIVWCNPAFDECAGVDHLALLGTPLYEHLVLVRDGQRVLGEAHPAKRVLAATGDVHEQFEILVGNDRKIVEVFGRRGDIGGAAAAVLLIHDVSEMASARRELEVVAAKLAAANSELEAFIYSVSHDLRTPLRAIDGFSQALFEDYGEVLRPEGKDFLQRMRAAAQRLSGLMEDMLRLSRLTRSDLVWGDVDLAVMCRDIASELAAAAPDRTVELVVPEHLWARADGRLLRQVMENLLGNAWKFTGKQPQPRVEVGELGAEDGRRVLFVRDNGVGFDMARADKLFGAFQRLHGEDEFPGSGIGLAIVRRVIHRHGGRVWADATVGRGATFYFILPGEGGRSS
jgi:signal transduction histidine kinase